MFTSPPQTDFSTIQSVISFLFGVGLRHQTDAAHQHTQLACLSVYDMPWRHGAKLGETRAAVQRCLLKERINDDRTGPTTVVHLS